MKRWRKVLIAVALLILLSQLPFAYRRYQLGKLNAAILSLNSQTQNSSTPDLWREYTGVAHVHSFLGGHSPGTLQEIVDAAHSNGLDFVLMTEHPSPTEDTAAKTLKGKHGRILFVSGNEIVTDTGDRLLVIPGDSLASKRRSTQEVLDQHEGLAFAAYPDEFKTWNAKGLAGIEVYNLFTNAKQVKPVVMFFDGLWSYHSYPHLLFARFFDRPAAPLAKWDELTGSGARLVAIGGNDAHANIGFRFSNNRFGITLDPYERTFRLVRMHVLIKELSGELDEASLLAALQAGHCFIGFDVFGNTSGFRFWAQDENEQRIMGDEITLDSEVLLQTTTSVPARFILFRNGVVVREESNVNRLEHRAKEKGVYRVEVYLPQLPRPAGSQPWIISNPIYVR